MALKILLNGISDITKLNDMILKQDIKLAVIGLGYVGLPVAVEFSRNFDTLSYDISNRRVDELKNNLDRNLEITDKEDFANLQLTSNQSDLKDRNVYIITVPTPIDHLNNPDLTPIKSATEMVAKNLKQNSIVIYESTVYPGATEEICAPIIENITGYTLNKEFYLGYSPERINPGDKEHTLTKITKITSGSTKEAAKFVDGLYSEILEVDTFPASSIRVAEAAKVIENIQRDVNIALINELAIIFNKLDIDSNAVLEAASSKWNFLNFRPGLVGGHCIGVDPYYLTYKAKSIGYEPEIILAGRRINNEMSDFVASEIEKTIKLTKSNNNTILIMGYTFKENCPDIRNTKVKDLAHNLLSRGFDIKLFDPVADLSGLEEDIIKLFTDSPFEDQYCSIVITVAHDEFSKIGEEKIKNSLVSSDSKIFDLKNLFPKSKDTKRL